LATVTQIRRKKNLDRKRKHNNNLAQVNAYESLFQTLTQKNGLRRFAWNGMMIITNEKNSVDYTRKENLHLKPLKDENW
jgi:hypothetical protein